MCRAAGSLGDADLVALRNGEAYLIEVKSTHRGPYHSFGPAQRRELLTAACQAGAKAWLCWWPPNHDDEWFPSESWPTSLEGGDGNGT